MRKAKPSNHNNLLLYIAIPGAIIGVLLIVLFAVHPEWLTGSTSSDNGITFFNPDQYPPFGIMVNVYPVPVITRSDLTEPDFNETNYYFPCVNDVCWGETSWFPALYTSNSTSVGIVLMGDEVAGGFTASLPTLYGTFGLIVNALQVDFNADGGSGMKTVAASDLIGGWTAYSPLALTTSTLGTAASWTVSYGSAPDGGAVAIANVDVAQFVFYGNGSSVIFTVGTDTVAWNYSIRIDNALTSTQYTVAAASTPGFIELPPVDLITNEQHRVLFVSGDPLQGATTAARLVSANFVNPVGVVLYDFTGYQWQVSQATSTPFEGVTNAELFVYAPGYWTAAETSLSTFITATTAIFNAWEGDILIVRFYIANNTQAMQPIVSSYLDQTAWLYEFCQTLAPRCAMIDYGTSWGDYELVFELGYMGDPTQPGLAGTSSYLLSNNGSLTIAEDLYAYLTEQVEFPCC